MHVYEKQIVIQMTLEKKEYIYIYTYISLNIFLRLKCILFVSLRLVNYYK